MRGVRSAPGLPVALEVHTRHVLPTAAGEQRCIMKFSMPGLVVKAAGVFNLDQATRANNSASSGSLQVQVIDYIYIERQAAYTFEDWIVPFCGTKVSFLDKHQYIMARRHITAAALVLLCAVAVQATSRFSNVDSAAGRDLLQAAKTPNCTRIHKACDTCRNQRIPGTRTSELVCSTCKNGYRLRRDGTSKICGEFACYSQQKCICSSSWLDLQVMHSCCCSRT